MEQTVRQPDAFEPGGGTRSRSARTMLCAACGSMMIASELRLPRPRAVSRVGAPVPPRLALATWECRACGRYQPRVEI